MSEKATQVLGAIWLGSMQRASGDNVMENVEQPKTKTVQRDRLMAQEEIRQLKESVQALREQLETQQLDMKN